MDTWAQATPARGSRCAALAPVSLNLNRSVTVVKHLVDLIQFALERGIELRGFELLHLSSIPRKSLAMSSIARSELVGTRQMNTQTCALLADFGLERKLVGRGVDRPGSASA